ncbi:MAG: hypothetical protein JWM71_2135 [Solirubrobacteraceae bacterium]|nr:hypothetical protein [Solirubrobacteraceae bacterium]
MFVAECAFVAIVVTPLALLVIDLIGTKSPDPSAPPARGVRQ